MPNRLANETSPYLQQHADNPVDWYPWGDDALKRAREQDRPILLSIGYSACHWCHVMKRAGSTDPAKFLPELKKTNYQGVIGPIAFDDKGDLVNGPLTIYVVKGGKWEPLETITPGAAPVPATAAAESSPAPDKK